MKRIVVTNSALAYPPFPAELSRPDDLILPLVERFEEALFMSGSAYDELRELFPDFNLQIRALAREIAAIFPDWLGQPVDEWGHSAWEIFADHFVKFSLGPLMVNSLLAERAAEQKPDEVIAWELPAAESWWSGRQMVGEVAETIAAESAACVVRKSSLLRRAIQKPLARLSPLVQATRYFRLPAHLQHDAPARECDVLFVLSGPTLVPLFDRVGSRLHEAHGLNVLGIETPEGNPEMKIAPGELERVSLYGFSEPSMLQAGIDESRAAARGMNDFEMRLCEIPALAKLPCPMHPVLARRLRTTVVRDVVEALYHARLWHRALDQLRPRILVAFNAYNEKLAPGVLQARHRGLPTITLQHGIWGPIFGAGALLPFDEVIVFGEYAQEMLQPLAAEHTRFTLTGHSLYDDVDAVDDSEVRSDLAGEYRYVVTITTQPTEPRLAASEAHWWLRGLAEACAELDALMVIKPHPHEEAALSRYRKLSEDLPGVRLLRHGELPLTELIAASDLMVTRYSTTAFEAALLGVPVMTVNLSGGPDQYPFAEEGAALGVSSYKDILPTLRELLTDSRARSELLDRQHPFLDRHLGKRDGRATERITERIAALARRTD